MTNNRYEDERVKQQKLKIGSEALWFLMMFLMASVLYKQFVLDAEFKEYMVEFIGFFGASVYIVIRNIFAGNNMFSNLKNKALYIIPLICGLATTAASFVMNREYHMSGENIGLSIAALLVSFASSAVGSFILIYVIYKSNKKRADKLAEKYDQ